MPNLENDLGNSFEKKVAIIIDGENFLGTLGEMGSCGKQFKADYSKLVNHLLENRIATKMIYVGKRPLGTNNSFYSVLRRIGFEIVVPENSFNIEKDWDDQRIIEILQNLLESTEDIVILVSGDHGFCEPLRDLKNKGKTIEIVSGDNNVSKDLLVLGKFINIKTIREEIVLCEKDAPKPSENLVKVEINISGFTPAGTIPNIMTKINKLADECFPNNNYIFDIKATNKK